MKWHRRMIALLGVVVASSPAAAQKAGSVEVGAFGRYEIFDNTLDLDSKLGFGGRLGIFATRRFELEGDVSRIVTTTKYGSHGDVRHVPIHARLIYNQPLGDAWALLIGAGYVRNEYRESVHGYDEGAGGLIGARVLLNDWLNFRVDVTSDYVARPINKSVENWNTGIQAGLGILLFNRKHQEAPVVAPPAPKPVDSDGDGVADSADRCSGTVPGVAVDAYGCSSSQLDADGDGVNNIADRCPNTPSGSSVDGNGCAASQKDSDNDGVTDDRDRCANTPAGTRVDGSGCPVIFEESKTAVVLEGVNFDLGKATLLPEARTVLDQVAASLVANPDVRVEVAGYTDNTGSNAVNVKLSNDRAGAVRAYLIERGVSAGQLEAKGYGPAKPVASNDTKEGRAQNRRVELHKIN